MEEDYSMDAQEAALNEIVNRSLEANNADKQEDYAESYDDTYEDDDGSVGFRNNRGRGNYRNQRGRPPPAWINGPPMRFRGRGYGPGGPPMRARGFFRGRGAPRFGPNNGPPSYDNNWGPMGPPPGMMGGPPPFGPPPGMMPPGGPMGPPPNMMSQPPPFGAPPGMPPPTMPQELWVETKSEDGKSYYYHVRSRETTWTRPQESPTCKVVTQQEVEAMAAAGQLLAAGPQQMPMPGAAMGPGGGMGPGMGPPPMGVMPNGMVMGQPPNVPSFMTTPPPWVKDANKEQNQDQDMAVENDEVPPGETAPPTQQGQPNAGMYAPVGGPPGGPGQAGPGGYAGWWAPPNNAPRWPPQMMGHPGHMQHGGPNNMQDAGVNNAGMATQGQAAVGNTQPVIQETIQVSDSPPQGDNNEKTVIPAEVMAAAGQWSVHRAPPPVSRTYYYNATTGESVWDKPQPVARLEELQAKIARENGEKVDDKKIESNIEVIDVEAHAEAVAAAEAEKTREAERLRLEQEKKEQEEKERLEKEKQEKLEKEKEKAKQDKSKPISSTPISGTPWCVVWTGDGRVFFYNPTAHASVWERPAALAHRADVDAAVANPPGQLQRKDGSTTTANTATTAAAKSSNGELKRSAADSDSSDSDSEPVKKTKADDKTSGANSKNNAPNKQPGQIDVGAAAAIEAEVRAARERGVVPHSARLRSFLAMLHEKQVSAFSTWEKELHKIVFDPRYLMLNSKERRQVFDQYVRDRAEEERKEKKNRLQQKKLAYRALMEEVKLHPKSSFTEFASKHGREERFKAIEKSRDRELYFNEYIAELRKKDKEEKERKREQAKTEFIALLKEKQIDRHARYNDIKKKIDSDPRYKAVEGGAMREDYFREYCKLVKDVSRKDKEQKERERSSKKEKKEKDRDADKEKEKEGKKEKKKDKNKSDEPEKKQPTPPPDQWAEILGIPGEEDKKRKLLELKQALENDSTSSDEVLSPKQLRSSKKTPTPEKVEKAEKVPIKSPPKKRKLEEFKSPEPEEKQKKEKRKTEKKKLVEKGKKKRKTEKE